MSICPFTILRYLTIFHATNDAYNIGPTCCRACLGFGFCSTNNHPLHIFGRVCRRSMSFSVLCLALHHLPCDLSAVSDSCQSFIFLQSVLYGLLGGSGCVHDTLLCPHACAHKSSSILRPHTLIDKLSPLHDCALLCRPWTYISSTIFHGDIFCTYMSA